MTSLLILLALAACGPVTRPGHGPDDAQPGDAPMPDVPPDIPDQPPPTPSRDLVGGAGRLSSATYTFDIEIGHAVNQQPASGPTYTIQGNAAIKP